MKRYIPLVMITIVLLNIITTITISEKAQEISNEKITQVSSLRGSHQNSPEYERKAPINTPINKIEVETSVQAIIPIVSGVIQVNVFDYDTSKPIASADVSVKENIPKGTVITGVTDKFGQFEAAGLSEGEYNVSVSKSDYQSDSRIVKLRSDNDQVITNIYLSKTPLDSGFIEVYVNNSATKQPLEDVTASLYNTEGKLVQLGKTDKNGFLNITKLTVQNYKILISKSGYVSQKKEVSIDYIGDYEKLYFYLTPLGTGNGFIEVTTLDFKGNLFPYVLIQVYNSSNDLIEEDKTNAAGFYNITNLEIGKYNVTASYSGYKSQSILASIDYSDDGDYLKFILKEIIGSGYIIGLVMDEEGAHLENADIKVYDESGLEIDSLLSDTDGYFNVTDLAIGYYYFLRVSKDGYITASSKYYLGKEGVGKIRIFLKKPYMGLVELTVVNESNSPIQEAIFEVYDSNSDLTLKNATDENGFANFTLNIGEYKIIIIKRGYMTETARIQITFNGDIDILLIKLRRIPTTLPNTGCIYVYVEDSDGYAIPDAYVRVVGELSAQSNYTGEKGEFKACDLYIGTYNVTVSKKGYTDSFLSTKIDYVGDVDKLSVVLYSEDSSTIELYVSGRNLPDQSGKAWIRYQLGDGTWSKWVETDDNGHISLPNMKIGSYTLEIVRSGFEIQHQEILITYPGEIISAGSILYSGEPDGLVEHWALIVAGQYDHRFTIDAYGLYYTLRNYYSYAEDHMYLLTPRETHPLSGNPVPRDRPTSLENVYWAINEIAWQSDADDKVLVWWTGHGGYYEMDAWLDDITAEQFDFYLDNIICDEMYIFLGPCHSGSMIPYLDDEQNRAIYTSCNTYEGGHAYFEHSYWPWATYSALHPLSMALVADDNSNGQISLYELYDYAYEYITITRGYIDQHPQRWVGTDISSDGSRYLGDGSYSNPIIDFSIEYLFNNTGGIELYDDTTLSDPTKIDVIASVNVLDNQLDNDDFAFQAINASNPNLTLVANVKIDIYFLNGTFYASATTNSSGILFFYDVPVGNYAWEAFYNNNEVDSGSLISDGLNFSVSVYPENWDRQGDDGDIRFSVEESSSHIFIPEAVILLYMYNGTLLGECLTEYIGTGFIYDIADGSYGWEAYYNDELVDEGIVEVDSSLFILATDSISPIVRIISPSQGEEFELNVDQINLQYTVVESNNYSIIIYLDGISIGFKPNKSVLTEINTVGNHTIKIQATDIAGNIGSYEIEIKILATTQTSLLTNSTTLFTSTTEKKGEITAGFELIFALFLFITIYFRKKKV